MNQKIFMITLEKKNAVNGAAKKTIKNDSYLRKICAMLILKQFIFWRISLFE